MSAYWTENSLTDPWGTFILCKKCDTKTRLYNPEKVEIVCCPKCKKVYSRNRQEYDKLGPKQPESKSVSIPLYSKGTIKGVEYIVVGCAGKHEKNNASAKWEEFVLVDEKGNYAFLNESCGHWLFVKERDKPGQYNKDLDIFLNDDINTYSLYSSYYQITRYAVGEFPYDVIDVKSTYTREFISPPSIFTCERRGKDEKYFQGFYLKRRLVAKAFDGAIIAMPDKEGLGSCQPFYFGIKPKRFTTLSLLFCLLTLPFFLATLQEPSATPLASLRSPDYDSLWTKPVVSPAFELEDGNSLLRFDSYSSVANDWMDADITLVNETTGKERSFTSGLEYYSGYDDEGEWHEGESSHQNYLGNVEPGKYHIEATFSGSHSIYRTPEFRIAVYKDYSTIWNYWLLMFSLIGISMILLLIENWFEKKRME